MLFLKKFSPAFAALVLGVIVSSSAFAAVDSNFSSVFDLAKIGSFLKPFLFLACLGIAIDVFIHLFKGDLDASGLIKRGLAFAVSFVAALGVTKFFSWINSLLSSL